jgi:hypothetical protein
LDTVTCQPLVWPFSPELAGVLNRGSWKKARLDRRGWKTANEIAPARGSHREPSQTHQGQGANTLVFERRQPLQAQAPRAGNARPQPLTS